MSRRRHKRPHGFVTLLFLLVLLSVGSYYLLRSLNDATRNRGRTDSDTAAALAGARDALLGYAVRYPDNPGVIDLDAGPGRLPCPDRALDGSLVGVADYPCASDDTGRFPWHTLDVPELRDASGAPFWYAVSHAYRVAPTATQWINSETLAEFGFAPCTGTPNLVAVLMAPNTPVSAQSSRATASYDAAQYLEGDNASANDQCFSNETDATRNDRVLAVTRNQLMQAVEIRVAADVENALKRYYAFDDTNQHLPWLAPFNAPISASYTGAPDTTQGLLPLRRVDIVFPAAFTARWSIPAGGVVVIDSVTGPTEECLRDSQNPACTDTTVWSSGTCEAQAEKIIRCTTARQITLAGQPVRRTYTFTLTDWAYAIEVANATSRRMQHFVRDDALTDATALEIKLTDESLDSDMVVTGTLGSSTLTLSSGNALDHFELSRVPFDLEVDDDGVIDPTVGTLDPTPDTNPLTKRSPGELPRWFTANRWHQLVYVAYASSFAPGGAGAPCIAGTCLTLTTERNGTVGTNDEVEALVIIAGAPLTAASQERTITSALGDYYEGDNADGNVTFEQRPLSDAFNDRMRVMSVAN